MMFYSTLIFSEKMTSVDSFILSGVIGVSNCFATLITLNLIDCNAMNRYWQKKDQHCWLRSNVWAASASEYI